MEVETKIKFKLWGDIFCLGKYDPPYYRFILEDQAIFRWAPSEGKAKLRFKRAIQTQFKKQLSLDYSPKLAHILLDYAWIEEVERKKVLVKRQLNLFQTKERSR